MCRCLLSESGVAAGTRRIEAITGIEVLNYINAKDMIIANIADTLKSNITDVENKAKNLVLELKNAEKTISDLKAQNAGGAVDNLIAEAKEIGGIKVIASKLDDMAMDELSIVGDKIKDKLACGTVIVLASSKDDKISFLAMTNKDGVDKGVHSGKIIKEVTAIAGGNGGGKPDTARGAGKDASKISDAIDAVLDIVKTQIGE